MSLGYEGIQDRSARRGREENLVNHLDLVPRPGGQVGVRITHSDRLDWSAGLKTN